MSARKILAFYSPYPGAGKTTAQKRILSALGRDHARGLSFADPVRQALYPIFSKLGIDSPDDFKGLPLPGVLGGWTFRDFLIAFGQAGRSVWPDIWVELLRQEIREASEALVVIDDLRMPNEYAMLREEGAKIVRITVPGRTIVPSETEGRLEGYAFDAELENTMDGLGAFHGKVWGLVEELWA